MDDKLNTALMSIPVIAYAFDHAFIGDFGPEVACVVIKLKPNVKEFESLVRLSDVRALLQKPIDMLLFCPACGMEHIDKPEEDTCTRFRNPDDHAEPWTNPPHKTHLCKPNEGGCGFLWRPCEDAYTNGIESPMKVKGPRLPTRGRSHIEAALSDIDKGIAQAKAEQTDPHPPSRHCMCDDCKPSFPTDCEGNPSA